MLSLYLDILKKLVNNKKTRNIYEMCYSLENSKEHPP